MLQTSTTNNRDYHRPRLLLAAYLRLHPREYLVVVPNIHQYLRIALDGIVQYTEWTGLEVRRFAGGGSVRHRCLPLCGGEASQIGGISDPHDFYFVLRLW